LARTYPTLAPHLKGIHLSLDSWSPWRKEDGWKLTLAEIRVLLEERGEGQGIYSESGEKAPTRVEWVPRLKDDVESLMRFMHMKTLPKPVARPPRKATVVYSFGDASGSGFRSSLAIGDSIHYQSGQWRPKINQESSNFRELSNIFNSLEIAHSQGVLENTEVFMFMDNNTAKAAIFKEVSKSRKVFDLVL
jgi:hypothetical protein